MNEEKFEKELVDNGFGCGVVLKICYTTDEERNVIQIDEEGMKEEFEMRLREVKELLE